MNEERARLVYAYIKANPGHSAGQVARALGMADGAVRNAIVATEGLGLYLCEEKGKLYVWEGSASAWRNRHADRQSGPK